MPELPEVQTICNELNEVLIGRELIGIESFRNNIVVFNSELVKGQTIIEVKRVAKYILIKLSKDQQIVVHLRMTGKLIFPIPDNYKGKYVRAKIMLDNHEEMIYDDVRCFGKIYVNNSEQTASLLAKLGVEPLSSNYNIDYLLEKSKNRRTEIKPFLMDQNIIVGIGNIYAQEILYHSKISPTRSVQSINKKEWAKIIKITREILLKAIECNGTTISDYRRVDDKTGEFQNFLQVYGKDKCPKCQSELVQIKQAGRSTRYCNVCQK
ncbi:MAG: bifunctional DNA-formamidopyrimidine glycosylase/DNA-(apurinic or apyrimidinic site) lyase [Candidatus Cloacimonadales bacterium]|jgi:formamidopyrimidine-DNA glycosylase|nr:bifunctional DNA-formamidopyrimidine glycosylase/DNA-(apurinic or apyrimidinic site) lyase [Candidatus Cloacimonadales bacterium]